MSAHTQLSEDSRPERNREQGTGNRERSVELEKASPSLSAIRDRDDAERICVHLADRIEANGSKRPTITQKWRDAARLMLDRDNRTEEQIHACIDWCQDDEFWRGNVMSLPKLREKYDQLSQHARRKSASVVAIDRRQQATNELFDRALERARARDAMESGQ